ncbi:hypothetical protein [Streptomyces sp. NPDC001828]|uniref:hypothetical protein n=1 Tax=Streptomyces sp. NPDC001828 TaxID=3364615 RepID=UPI00367F8D0A
MNELLTYQGKSFINFRDYAFADARDHAYRWVDVKHFLIVPESARDEDLLTALIAHPQFRDNYASDEEGRLDPTGERHGDYWARHITATSYSHVTASAAADTVREWAHQFGPLPEALANELQTVALTPLIDADCYQLGELDDEFLHDWGGSHIDFHEFVLINRSTGSLSLLVATDD